MDAQSISEYMHEHMTNQSESTKKLHWGNRANHFRGNLYRLFKKSGFEDDIRDGLEDEMLEQIVEDYGGTDATKLRTLQSLSLAVQYHPHLSEYKENVEMLMTDLNRRSEAQQIVRRQKETISKTFSEMKQLVCNHFGEHSAECLYMEIYSEVPSRDDFGNLKVYRRKPIKEEGNYILLHEKRATFVLQNYKTKQRYGVIETPLSKKLRDKISNHSSPLFPVRGNKMTTWVDQMLKQSGAKEDSDVGNINLLRKAYVSEKYNNQLSQEEILKLADEMKHSPLMSLNYIRSIKK